MEHILRNTVKQMNQSSPMADGKMEGSSKGKVTLEFLPSPSPHPVVLRIEHRALVLSYIPIPFLF